MPFFKMNKNIFYTNMKRRICFFLTILIITLIVFAAEACTNRDVSLKSSNFSENDNQTTHDSVLFDGKEITENGQFTSIAGDFRMTLANGEITLMEKMIGFEPYWQA